MYIVQDVFRMIIFENFISPAEWVAFIKFLCSTGQCEGLVMVIYDKGVFNGLRLNLCVGFRI